MLKNSLSHEALNSTSSFLQKSNLFDSPKWPFFCHVIIYISTYAEAPKEQIGA